MSNETMPAFKRRAFAKDDGTGGSVAEWTLTPSSQTDLVQIVAEPIQSLPVIFVPGIMGSNLMTTVAVDKHAKGQAVWLMDDKAGALLEWYRATPAQRQARLNPLTTAVTGEGAVDASIGSIGDAAAIRKNRFWGEVSAMSYGDFLPWLQRSLNHRRIDKWRALIGPHSDFAAKLAPGMAFEPLAEADVQHAANFRFPVYACGYNWLRSNHDAAKTLAARIEQVIAANNSSSYSCEQVILVTHSMGGLVARACSELAGMRQKIAGIVHGVMPANGAAVAYKRVRTGTEGAAGLVIGDTAAKVTAVFANSPGALQLLPNKDYGSGWLKFGMSWAGSTRTIASLPQADPYEEIYKQRGPWWALVREEQINPGDLDGHRGWQDYLANIDAAANFHVQLRGKYHPNTYTFHGDGTDGASGMTWGKVGWSCASHNARSDPSAAELLGMKFLFEDGHGQISAGTGKGGGLGYPFFISAKDSAGDGTVPVHSGAAPAAEGARATYRFDLGQEGHEGAYRVDIAQRATLHGILRIARSARVLL